MSRTRFGPILAWVAVALLTAALVAVNVRQSLVRYRELDTGWSWDLAYYNQWFWALTKGDGVLSVRPQSAYGSEAASIWRANYLTPIRLLIAPIYAARPGPETLLVVEAVLFWLVVPAAYLLARREGGSIAAGLAAAGLVPLTPLLLPLAANDFRELQLAIPFALVAVEGVRGRSRRLSAVGIGGLLACRQEFGLMVATLALVPPRVPEGLGTTVRWARATVLTGVGWTLLFLLYLAATRSTAVPEQYLRQFLGAKAPLDQTIETLADFLLVGLGAWGVLMLGVPRMALLVLPWAWSLASGRWALRYLAEEEWHSVRYAAPLVAIGVAAGVLGFARLLALSGRLFRGLGGTDGSPTGASRGLRLHWWESLKSVGPPEDPDDPSRRTGWVGVRVAQLGLVAATAVGLLSAREVVRVRFSGAPRPVSVAEAEGLWPWIERVGPDEGVMADYRVAAPLSSRRLLRSYILAPDRPPGYPDLDARFRWVFARPAEVPSENWTAQGFVPVHRGETISVFRRPEGAPAPTTPPEKTFPKFPTPWIQLDDANRVAWALPIGLLLLWPWVRLRRAWRASSRASGLSSGAEAALGLLEEVPDATVLVVDEAPRDLADPARRALRLAPATADGRDLAATTLAALEAAHLKLGLAPGLVGRLARWRPPLVVAARLGTTSGWLTVLTGLLSGSRFVLDLGLMATFALAALPILAYPLERLAAGLVPGDADRRLLSALAWRHVADAVPLAWRRG